MRGLGTPTASQRNILDSEKLTRLSCAPREGVRTRVTDVTECWVRRSTNWFEPPRHLVQVALLSSRYYSNNNNNHNDDDDDDDDDDDIIINVCRRADSNPNCSPNTSVLR